MDGTAGAVTIATSPGLFGKMPAYGDFVRRGWPDATADAIDGWLTDAMLAARAVRDDAAFADWMRAAPMWWGYVPAGLLGPLALRIALAPSVDRAGRLFPIVAGVAGEDRAVWAYADRNPGFAAALDAAVYDAVAGRLDADAMLARLGGTGTSDDRADVPAPGHSLWWPGVTDASEFEPLRAERVDAALLERLLAGGRP